MRNEFLLNETYLAMCDMVSFEGGQTDFRKLLQDEIRPPASDSIWVRLAYASGIIAGNSTEVQIVVMAAILLIHRASALLDDLQDGDLVKMEITPPQVINAAIAMSFAPLHALPTMLGSLKSPACVAIIQAEVASTVMKMCSGQFAEASQSSMAYPDGGLEGYQTVVREKISSFSVLCARLPAIAGSLDAELIDALTEIGRSIGLLYQIGNDYAGLSASKRNRSTDVGNRWTWPTLYTFQVLSVQDRQSFLRAWKMQDVDTVYQCALDTGALEFLLLLASTYKAEALKALSLLDRHFETNELKTLINAAFPPLAEV